MSQSIVEKMKLLGMTNNSKEYETELLKLKDALNSYDRELFGDILADVDVEEIKESYRRIHLTRDEKKADIKQKLEKLEEGLKEWPEIKPLDIKIEIPVF